MLQQWCIYVGRFICVRDNELRLWFGPRYILFVILKYGENQNV